MMTKKKKDIKDESLEENKPFKEEEKEKSIKEEVKPEEDDISCDNIEDLGEDEETLILKNKIENLEEKVRYHQAELINYRKRKDEEVSNMLKYANQDLIMEILPIVDNFERALKLSEKDETNAKFAEGFKMLYNGLVNTLHKFGVEEIKSTGEKFDPTYHEALLIENDQTKEDDIIIETLITGYTYKGRVIRPSSVKVNKIN